MTDPMELVGLVEGRIGQDFDGECHLTADEARQLAACIREMVEWRPIETAPRDGTHILIAPHMDVALWDHGAERWITNVIPLNSDLTIADDWRARPVMMFEQYASNWGIEPTHWLPLPPAPGAFNDC